MSNEKTKSGFRVLLHWAFIFPFIYGSCTDVFSWWKYCIRKSFCGIKKIFKRMKEQGQGNTSVLFSVYTISVITFVETHLYFDSDVVVDMIRPIYAQVQTTSKEMKNHFYLWMDSYSVLEIWFWFCQRYKWKKMACPTAKLNWKVKGMLRFNINILCVR